MSTRKKARVDFDALSDDDPSPELTGREMLLEIMKSADRFSISNSAWASSSDSDFLYFLSVKLGLQFVDDLRLVLSVVPVECGPWRQQILVDLLESVRQLDMTTEEREAATTCVLRGISIDPLVPLASQYELALQKALPSHMTHDQIRNEVYGGCLAPPTTSCYSCDAALQKNNPPVYVNLYTSTGAIPMKKVELRCRVCNINYGMAKYGNKEMGYKYYSSLRAVAEASDICYIDRLVMNMFCALRYANFKVGF